MSLDLTVVVCTYNVVGMIRDCLESVKANDPARIILVDGGSTDGTREIAADYVDDILDDHAKGLAHARNIGIDNCSTTYITFVGPDNVMPEGSLKAMIDHLEDTGCGIVSAVTLLRDTGSYWGWAQNIYRLRKYTPGSKDVVGTPTLFRHEIAAKYRYNEAMKNSDDTELCSRMAAEGHTFAIAPTECLEIGFDNFASVVERWTRYGRGDYLYYLIKKNSWGLGRKLKSWLHPFVHDVWWTVKRIRLSELGVLPFLAIIVVLRYFGWLKSWLLKVENRTSVV